MTNYVNFSSRGQLKDKRVKCWAKADLAVKAREVGIALQDLVAALEAEAVRRQAAANEASKTARILKSEAAELQVEIAQVEKDEAARHATT